MVFGISPSLFIKTGSAVFGMYGAQMLFVPKMIHEDNFESPANECAAATHMHSCRGVRSPRAIPYARAKASDARANIVRRRARAPRRYTNFIWRGASTSLLAAVYAINQMPAEAGAKVLLVWTAAVAVLYPYNAKFGYLSKVEPKYPMHYVPEVLMPTLVAMGIISLLK